MFLERNSRGDRITDADKGARGAVLGAAESSGDPTQEAGGHGDPGGLERKDLGVAATRNCACCGSAHMVRCGWTTSAPTERCHWCAKEPICDECAWPVPGLAVQAWL